MNPLTGNLKLVSENNTIDKIGNNKVARIKSQVRSVDRKKKSKNWLSLELFLRDLDWDILYQEKIFTPDSSTWSGFQLIYPNPPRNTAYLPSSVPTDPGPALIQLRANYELTTSQGPDYDPS